MKKKDLESLRKKTLVELEKMLGDKKKEVAKTKTEMAVGKEKNLKKVKNLSHEMAQIKTLMRQLEMQDKVQMSKESEKEVK